jgi:hypothetical protein
MSAPFKMLNIYSRSYILCTHNLVTTKIYSLLKFAKYFQFIYLLFTSKNNYLLAKSEAEFLEVTLTKV